MAVIHDYSPDFKNNELRNVLLQLLSANPGTAVQGKIFLDTEANEFRVSLDGNNWSTVATTDQLSDAGVSLETVMDTLGNTVVTEGTNINITYDDAANGGIGSIAISVDAAVLDRDNHTGTQTLSTITGHDKAAHDSLDIDAATVDGNTPSDLRDRTTHSGTQALGTITGHNKAAHDSLNIDAGTVGGNNATFLLNRANHTGTIGTGDVSGFVEAVEDAVGELVETSTTVSVTYDDAGNALTLTVLDSPTVGGQTPAQLRARSSHTGNQEINTITGLQAALDGKAANSTVTGIDTRLSDAEDSIDGLGTAAQANVGDFDPAGTGSSEADSAQAHAIQRSNHTGTQLASTISDFAATVAGLSIDADTVGGQTAAQIETAVTSAITDGAPAALDTLNEIAAALNDNPNAIDDLLAAVGVRNQTYAESYGDNAATTFTITHGLGTRDVSVTVRNATTGAEIFVPNRASTVNQVVIEHTTVPGVDEYRAIIQGRAD